MEQDFRRSLTEKAKEKTYLGKLVILSGISGSGKNFIADILLDRYNYVLIDKYVTRPFRDKEVTEMSLGKNIGIKAVNGVYNDGEKSVEEQERNANIRKQAFLNLRLPFSYINYGEYYGFSATEINNYLESGRNVTIIVNDIGIVRDLKSIYGENCLACFVYRVNPNNKGIFMQIAGQRHDTQESAEARHKQAVKDFNTYTNNVALYDYTILNTGIGKDDISKILEDLTAREFESIQTEKSTKCGSPKIYAYIGNPGSGKDDVLEIARVQGMLHSLIVPKHTTRARREDDGEEMICPGDLGFDIDSCDILYTNYGTRYGINSNEIRERLEDGISSSIVVSNEYALAELAKRFPEELVKVYIQGLSKQEYIAQHQEHLSEPYVQRRILEYEKADNLYQRNLSTINHVIINTGDLKDLKMQMDNIIALYENGRNLSLGEFRSYMNVTQKYIARFERKLPQQEQFK